MYHKGVYPDLNEMFNGPNIPLLLSEVFAMYIAKDAKLTVYSEKDLNGDVIFEGIGPKYYYIDTSEITSSNKSDYTAFDTDIAQLDESSFVNSDLLDENGDFIENALNPLALGPGYNDTSTYLPRMSDTFFGRHGYGSFKIEFIGTPTVIGSGAKGKIHVEGNRITSYSLTNAGSGYDRSLYESQPGTMILLIKMEEWLHVTSNGSNPPKSDPVDRMQDPRTRAYSIAEFQDGTERVNHYKSDLSDYSSPNFPGFSAGISDHGQINSINISNGYNFQNTTYDWVRISPLGGVTTYTWALRTYTFELTQWNIPGKDM
jgi:hypothetical protein